MRNARFDLPEVDAFTRPYWEAAAEGKLLLRRCRAAGCGAAHHYPREFCPYCWSEDVVWEPASGRATLYTWSVVHRNDLSPFGDRVPYVAAVVDLAEGPRMMTEITDCAPAELRIGMPLMVRFRVVALGAEKAEKLEKPGKAGKAGKAEKAEKAEKADTAAAAAADADADADADVDVDHFAIPVFGPGAA